MKTLDPKSLGIGALAGLTAVFLVLGASAQPSFSAVLYGASALPILLVGLGWGNMAAISAVITGALVGALAVSPSFALMMVLVTLLPAGWISHLANLARPASELGGPDHLMAWYPLSDILLHLCGLVTIGIVAVGVMIGYGPELVGRAVDLLLASISESQPEFTADPAIGAQTKAWVLLMLPALQAGMWVLMLFAAYYVAMRIVTASSRSLRPREDLPSALRMNRNSIFVFLLGLCAIFAGGVPALIGASVVGAFGAGFLMAGFASMHFRTRGKDWRIPALILSYLACLLLVLPMLPVLVLGLSDTRKAIALTPAPDQAKNPPKQ